MTEFEDMPILEPLSPARDDFMEDRPPSPDLLKYGSSSRYISHKDVSENISIKIENNLNK